MNDGIIGEGAGIEKGENARMASFVGAIAIADLVKSTLGPKGMDKILQSMQSEKVSITNDGATILKSIYTDNPAAKVLVELSKSQDDEVGDGTTSVVVLTGELLRECERLCDLNIHPQTIVQGFREASACARAALEGLAFQPSGEDDFQGYLLKCARTVLSSKILSGDREHFAQMAVGAVMRLRGKQQGVENIQIIKKVGGTLSDSFLEEGFLLDKKIGVGQPRRIENAKILVANTAMDTDKIKIYGARVRVDSMDKVAGLEKAEKEKMRAKCEKIISHGINVFVNRQLIYNFPEQLFADAGVLAIEHADFAGVERLAAVVGAEIVSTFDHPEGVKVGEAALVEEVMIGEDKLIRFSGIVGSEACSVVLRGASSHVLDEAERSLHDALCVLYRMTEDDRVVPGGGCPEARMAAAVDALATRTPGKRALAIEAFGRALRGIPATIANNAGLDSTDLMTQLRAAHAAAPGASCHGVDVIKGAAGDMKEAGIFEAFKVKAQILSSATEATEMILRVDDVIKCAPRQREG